MKQPHFSKFIRKPFRGWRDKAWCRAFGSEIFGDSVPPLWISGFVLDYAQRATRAVDAKGRFSLFTRTRYQYGSLQIKERTQGKEVWEFRYYELDSGGGRQRRAVIVGTREEYPTESAARKSPAIQAILLRLNAEQPSVGGAAAFGAVIARYEQEEMPERYSTKAAYGSYINNQIRPRWADMPTSAIKPMVVEDWLKNLALAPKTKSHVRSLMHTIFQCAERWELIDKNPIKLVRVREGPSASKRLGSSLLSSSTRWYP